MIEYVLSFIAVVKAHGFSNAAKKTNMSKAKLSRHIQKLEEQLGAQLLQRTTRSLIVTEAGKQFFESCCMIEENYHEAVENLKQDIDTIQGTLKITAPIDFGIEFMPDILDQFTKRHPKIKIVLSLSNINENLAEDKYHVGFRIANQLPDSNLRVLTLKKFKRIICATPKYFKNKKKPTELSELKNLRCITSVNHNTSLLQPQWTFYQKNKTINFSLSNAIEVDSLLAQLKLIYLGTGIGRMPDYFIRESLNSGKLIEIFPHIEKPYSYIYLLYPNKTILPKKTRAFVDFVKEYFKK